MREPSDLLRKVIAADEALLATFGMALDDVGENSIAVTAVPPDSLVNSLGVAHGSLLFTVADTAAAYALANRGLRGATIGSSMSFSRPARAGIPVRAEAIISTQGRTLATVQSTVTSAGRTVALGTFQFYLIADERPAGAG